MHDVDELNELMRSADFREFNVQAKSKTLHLPAPADFLWQYIHSTPLAEAVAQASQGKRDAIERDVCPQWQEFVVNGTMSLQVGVTTATALK
jgi:hypothetical protein